MGSGKLVLLIAAGSAASAGILLASATTHAIRTYPKLPPDLSRPSSDLVLQPPVHKSPSWIDEGLSALDTPAWPFGPDEWDGSNGTGPENRAGSPADGTPFDDGSLQELPPGGGGYAEDDGTGAASTPGTHPDQNAAADAAADAAERASAAAADVTAAENAGN